MERGVCVTGRYLTNPQRWPFDARFSASQPPPSLPAEMHTEGRGLSFTLICPAFFQVILCGATTAFFMRATSVLFGLSVSSTAHSSSYDESLEHLAAASWLLPQSCTLSLQLRGKTLACSSSHPQFIAISQPPATLLPLGTRFRSQNLRRTL